MNSHHVVLTLASLMFLMCLPVSQSCNKALCASDVSKCLIQAAGRKSATGPTMGF
ncbi:twisted gastrulation homolog 1 (Drosophila) (predicted), isoform CRA_a [Rattus norvegicus]|uniref:Twisted gastrulation homolog 1 (Drosophila) (Predicted), isoform CRA_a n=1 Tax=Rattus norvegicus TaxID=10116 RepID=A6JRD7_RAT|nr:twisted gastrulation homolog 1 (Drosophila) (predicted), isoform CRA_a [Rattus norvegicus]